ncbi:MAG: ubiquinol-cytochrome C chaperone family protein [Blastomonas sp.]
MNIIGRIFGRSDPHGVVRPLYMAVIQGARDPAWYREAGVADTINGRFEAMCMLVCLLLLRLEREENRDRADVLLTELFVTDMDGQLREAGVGDLMVGKHIGKMMSALGGRLGSMRSALAQIAEGEEATAALGPLLARNLHEGREEPAQKVQIAARRIAAIHDLLADKSLAEILAGDIAMDAVDQDMPS